MIKQVNKVGANIVPDIQIVAKIPKCEIVSAKQKKNSIQIQNYQKIGKHNLIGSPTLELPGAYGQ